MLQTVRDYTWSLVPLASGRRHTPPSRHRARERHQPNATWRTTPRRSLIQLSQSPPQETVTGARPPPIGAPATRKRGPTTILPERILRASTLPCQVVMRFSVVCVGDCEASARAESSAHEASENPTPEPDRTVNLGDVRLRTDPGCWQAWAEGIGQRQSRCDATSLRMKLSQDTVHDGRETHTNKPCLSTTTLPPDLSVKHHGHQTGQGIRVLRKRTHCPAKHQSSDRNHGFSSREVRQSHYCTRIRFDCQLILPSQPCFSYD